MENEESLLKSNPFREGQLAFLKNLGILDDPYKDKNSENSIQWQNGWLFASRRGVEIEKVLAVSTPIKIKVLPETATTNISSEKYWGCIGELFSGAYYLGLMFIIGVIILAVIKWAFRIVF